MRKNSRANKGQFFVIAALLVSVVLVGGVISTYSLVRNSTVTTSPDVLGAIGEMNTGIKSILDFTVGYYGSILQVTGNSSYAQGLTSSYLSSGLVNIARSHPEWNPSFNVSSEAQISTSWFMPESSSTGEISVTYSLGALGLEGITYETSSALTVNTLTSASGQAKISVMRDGSEPELGLTVDNFLFYNYSYADSTWELVNPTNIVISANGVYTMNLPNGVGPNSYSVQIEDNRGIVVSAFYSPSSVESESGIPHYTYTFDWESTGVSDIYDSLATDNFVIEILQNGTLKWLGQPFEMDSHEPIPPISVKAFRVNATINDVNQQIPFQVEDWASDYLVPLGLSSNDTLFSETNMLVFMVDNEVSEVTLWWDGNDTATPSSFAWQNNFSGDFSDTYDITLSNGNIDLNVQISGGALTVGSTSGFTSSDAKFLRINGEHPTFGAGTSVVIADGSVRTILQQEPEYSGGATNCPNFYAQLYFTLPLGTNYYTYTSRLLFVESNPSLGRILTNLNIVEVDASAGDSLTENGTSSGYPVPDGSTGSYYDQSPSTRDHHWSEFISGSSGTGVMFRDVDSSLYNFDDIFSCDTGAIVVEQTGHPSYNRIIEVNPVELDSVDFDNSLDAVWTGAIVTFNGEPIHPTAGNVGLWVMVENPPTVSMDEEITPSEPILEFYVDELSDEDSSPDKGSHSDFSAQQSAPDLVFDELTEASETQIQQHFVDQVFNIDGSTDVGSHSSFINQQVGPDSGYDTLTEANAGGGSGDVILIDTESFEGVWPPTNPNDWTRTGNWNKESNRAYAGTYSADFDGSGIFGTSGSLQTCNLHCSDADSIHIEFRFYDEDLASGDFILEYFAGTTLLHQVDLGALHSSGGWYLYEEDLTTSNYFVDNFNIRWRAEGLIDFLIWEQHAYVDLVTITKQVTQTSYDLDLEVQWTDIQSNLPNEELAIYCGDLGDEVLSVDAWTGSVWEPVIDSLQYGWNNVSVSQWLTSSDFTIRFIDGTEGVDETQNSWQIDVALLRVWDADNYEIDLEEHWTNVDFDEANEELCIYVGEVASEDLRVDVWTGTWIPLGTLVVGENIFDVSPYLNSSTFTIRFIGTAETGDTIQNQWTIDASLLHTWS